MQPQPAHTPYVPYSSTEWGDRILTTEKVAALLGIQPASLYQLVLRNAFPEGQASSVWREKVWPLDVVLRFVIEQRRQFVGRVPRLFPRIDPIPALFCGARSFTAKSRSAELAYDCVAYLWQPSDGGRPVALVYNLRSPGWQPQATELLAALHDAGHTDVAAVALPSGSSHVKAGGVIQPPEVDYADTREPGVRLREVTWFDLAYLLQVDIPWWPQSLRDKDAMLRWQPGDPPYAVVPRQPIAGDPHALLRLGATVHPDAERAAAAPFFQWFAERAACYFCPPVEQEPHLVPGICVAARAVAPGTGAALSLEVAADRGRPTPAQTARILHSRVDPEAFDEELRQLAYTVEPWSPLIERVVGVRVGSLNPLARQFLSRLRESDAPVDELGFLIVAAHGRDDQRIKDPLAMTRPRRLEHELNRDLWIARFGDAVYVSVPQVISTASGVLQQLDITQDRARLPRDFTAWWTDTAGNAWPVPGHDAHEAGFGGAGPDDLAAAATVLAHDAASPVGGAHNRAVLADVRYQQLAKLLMADRYPTLIRRLDDPARGFRWHTDTPPQ